MCSRFRAVPNLFPIATTISPLVTHGSLILPFLLAVTSNPRGGITPNLFLVLLIRAGHRRLVGRTRNQFILGRPYVACRVTN
jgi:hypothetical protein